ncbi:hypothetical protein BHE74_00057618 [Ensete ventricosum]|nr:hypothetical protein BHE74_00057618 [Ensete ventricosum]
MWRCLVQCGKTRRRLVPRGETRRRLVQHGETRRCLIPALGDSGFDGTARYPVGSDVPPGILLDRTYRPCRAVQLETENLK